MTQRSHQPAAGRIQTRRIGRQGEVAVVRVAEERIRREIPVATLLPRNASDPVTTHIPIDIAADCGDRGVETADGVGFEGGSNDAVLQG